MTMVKALLLLTVFLAIAVPSVTDHYGVTLVNGITIYPYEAALFMTIFFFLFGFMIGKEKLKGSTMNGPLILFLALIALETVRGAMLYGLKQALYDVRTTVYYGVFFILISVFRTRKDFEQLLKVMAAGALSYSAILAFQFVAKSGALWAARPDFLENVQRIGSSNAMIPLFILPFAILPVIVLRDPNWKNFSLMTCLALAITTVISQSRAGLLFAGGTLVSSILVLARFGMIQSALRWVVLASIACAGGVFLMNPDFIARLGAMGELTLDSSFNTRLLTALIAFDKIAASPWIGYGYGGLMMESTPELKGTILDMTNFFIDWSWITLAYKTGILGTGLFAWVWWKAMSLLYRTKPNDLWIAAMRACLFISLPLMMLLSIQNVFLVRGQLIVCIAAFLALSEGLFRLSTTSERSHA